MTNPERPEPNLDADLVAAVAPDKSSQRIPASPSSPADPLSVWGDRVVLGIARHWLAFFNLAIFLYLSVPVLAPMLMEAGATGPARLIYTIYSPACHQLPDRSYFLFGEQPVYSLQELEQADVLTSTSLLARRRYIGDVDIGYKVALCERDLAIYGSVLLGGLLFAVLRSRVPKLPFKFYLLFLVPIALDGFTQLFGLRSSNWLLRTITGSIFGLATVWLAYPHIEESMVDIRQNIERKLAGDQGKRESP